MQFKRQLENLSRQTACHPKMVALRDAVLDHFQITNNSESASNEASQEGGQMVPGRIIIFSSYRESVNEILAMLQKHEPAVKARQAPFCSPRFCANAHRKVLGIAK